MFSRLAISALGSGIGGATESTFGTPDPLDEIIDVLADAVLLVDRRGQVVHANIAGRRALADHRLDLAALCDTGRPDRRHRGREGMSSDDVMVLTTQDGVRHVCHALQLRSMQFGERLRLIVIRTSNSTEASRIAQSLFGLTGRERDVLHGLIEIGGVPEIALALNITPATIRSHLKALFAKTGTSRQSDLVRLVSEIASPFPATMEAIAKRRA